METPSHILFYGHLGHQMYKEFSNFYPCNFFEDSNLYNCSEQYFMKKKQELFDPNNVILAQSIMQSNNPTKIKAFGRKVRNFNESHWKTVRSDIMYDALILKFNQNINLTQLLLSTGNKTIVEAAARDRIWGAGMTAEQIINNNYVLKGRNLLGQVLMRVRDEIQNRQHNINS